MSDIVDNRREKLVDTIGRILKSTERGRFAVGCGPLVSAVERRLNQLQRRSDKGAATRELEGLYSRHKMYANLLH